LDEQLGTLFAGVERAMVEARDTDAVAVVPSLDYLGPVSARIDHQN
jgi:hypothetical protein